MKIALYHVLPPGGAIRFLAEHLRLSSQVHEYKLFTLDMKESDPHHDSQDNAFARRVAESCSSHQVLPVPGSWLLARLGQGGLFPAVVRAERHLARAITESRCDVALVHPSQVTQAPWLLQWLDLPTVYFMQEVRRRTFEVGYVQRRRARGLARVRRIGGVAVERAARSGDIRATKAADRLVCNSYFTAEAIQRSYGRIASVCYPGVDGDVFALATSARSYVLSVGAIDPVKEHSLVIRALGHLPARRRPPLRIVYERAIPDHERELRELAAHLGVDLILERSVPENQLIELYQGAAVTACASRLEPFGLTAIESMSCGTPVVAVREGGFRETVIDGVNGCLVARDSVEFGSGIRDLLNAPPDPIAVRESAVGRFSWERSVAALHEVLEEAACQIS